MMKLNNRLFYFAIELVNKAIPFLLLPYISSAVGGGVYGKIEIFTTNYIILSFLFTFGFEGWMNSNYYKMDLDKFNTVMSSFFIVGFIIFLLLVLIGLFVSSNFIFLIFVGYSQSLLNLTAIYLRLKSKYISAGVILLISSISNALLVFLCFHYLGANYNARIDSFLFSAIICIVLVVMTNFYLEKIKIKISFEFLNKEIILFCLPLCLSMVFNWARGNVDKYFISTFIDYKSLGVYAVAFQLASVVNVIGVILNRTLQADLLRSMAQGFQGTKKIICVFLFSILFISFFYFVGMAFGFRYIFSPEFFAARSLLFSLTICFVFLSISSFLINFMLFFNRPNIILLQTVVITVVHIAISFILVKHYALYGAIATQLFTATFSLCSTILVCYFMRKRNTRGF